MDVNAGFAVALATLRQAAHDPELDDIDLEQLLSELARDVKLAVHSYLGMSLSVGTVVGAFCLTAMDQLTDAGDILTSLHLPLTATSDTTPASTVTLYAGTTGAFVDLAADVGWILSLAPGLLVLDGHLTTPDRDPDTGLEAISRVNQALGLLIEHGTSPENALDELHRLAGRAGLSKVKFATQLVDAQWEPQ